MECGVSTYSFFERLMECGLYGFSPTQALMLGILIVAGAAYAIWEQRKQTREEQDEISEDM
jgi:hypothetical protein